MSSELVKREDSPASVLEIIQQAVATKQDVETLRGLFELQRDFMRMQAEQSFHAAMARLQAKLPQINKYGQGKNSKFAKLEDIDTIIRPLLAEEGFSFSFDEESHTEKTLTFIAKISHSQGHSEVKRLTVPIDAAAKNRDGNAVRPAIQDAGSTVSYARRYLIKMHLNIIETNEDTDGNPTKTITPDQALDIEAMLAEVKGDRAGFLKYMGVDSIDQILERDHKKAIESLNAKRRSMNK
jgi:hypothetical protein